MNPRRYIPSLLATLLLLIPASVWSADPLRVFIRAGAKTHGPNQHDHPRFLGDWTQLLGGRGIHVEGAMTFPTAEQLAKTDVMVIYAADGMNITGQNRVHFESFLQRGGGFVVIHDGVVSADQHEWAKKVQGGAWVWARNAPDKTPTKWYEGEVGIYFVDTEHPITRGISNFDWKDEIYYDLDMASDAQVLATSFHSVFVIAPQLWTYEKTWEGGAKPYRAFVSLPGHEYDVFNTPHYRALLLRGIAWAGRRSNVDEFCKPEELNSLKYPEGGPVAPAKALETFNVHPEFAMNLVTSEPLVEKVISLDWDAKGRLWVAETPEYPGGRTINKNDNPVFPDRALNPDQYEGPKVERRPKDRISWLEDSNGDGRMDKKHVFAEGLELVTSLVFYKDGVIVAQAPDILWLRDRNGDGRCDMVEGSEKITLYTGFGTFDTHAVINNFRWGLDGWVYSAIGYSAGQPKSPDGSKDFGRVTAGIIRFKPDGSAVEQYASGSCNTWGFDFGPDGEAFYTTATCGEHFLHIVMPEKILARGSIAGVRASSVVPDHQKIAPAVNHTRPAYIQIDWVGMFTAAAGCCIYNGGAWPERFNGSHFCSETTMSLVHNEFLRPEGATYVASKESGREDQEFIAGTDLWFRPVHERVGPDGALYVVDFYNQAAIHNDTRGPAHGAHNAATRPDRDHHFARIWRVQHKQAKKISFPELDKNKPANLVKALESPNGWVRDTAARLLRENGARDAVTSLVVLANASNQPGPARIAALHTLNVLGQLNDGLLATAVNDADAVVRKNALRIAYERETSGQSDTALLNAIKLRLHDRDPRVKLNAIIALGNYPYSAEAAEALFEIWPRLQDKYQQSAVVGVVAKNPGAYLSGILTQSAKTPEQQSAWIELIRHAARLVAQQQDAALAAQVLVNISKLMVASDLPEEHRRSMAQVAQSALETLATHLRAGVNPEWTLNLREALASLLQPDLPGLSGAVLPFAARWDVGGTLEAQLRPAIRELTAKLQTPSVSGDERAQVAVNLIGVRNVDSSIIPEVAKLLDSANPADLQRRVIEALGATSDEASGQALIAAYTRVPIELRDLVFEALVKRADWSLALVQAISEGKINTLTIGPGNLHRLRTHASAAVAAKANEVIDSLRGPERKEKDELIAELKHEVEKPGNIENGKQLYAMNCANCHVFKEEGRNLAPNLTGMGAHGAAELLVHIVDPNRLVEPNFLGTSIDTKDGLTYDGVVERENRAEVVLRNAAGDYTIRKDDIASRRSTGRSLMPEGFEALGAEGMRDLLAYICAEENRYRILDLTSAFTANASRGIYNSPEARDETLRFRRFGLIKVGDVPFDIISPAKSPTGNNVIVLKGGAGFAKTMPQQVEAKAGFAASKLHFLGGVGGWAYPYGGDEQKGKPVVKMTLHYAGGGYEEIILRNGVEIADYIGSGPRFDVPGSKRVDDLLQRGQVRWFTKEIKGREVIDRIVLESFDNQVAPTFVAITAEMAEASGSGHRQTSAAPAAAKVLIVGGGNAHDFDRWFNQEDTKVLSADGTAKAEYTDQPAEILPKLKEIDVLYLSNNQPLNAPGLHKGIFDFVNSGKGLLLVHASTWINWRDWPEYNRVLVTGGSRSHDRYGEFEVTVTDPNHPVMAGVPAKFKINDELYKFIPDPEGSERQVLATGKSPHTGDVYPVVWITQHPKARIVCITLGHDGQSHTLPAFQTLLKNSVRWTANRAKSVAAK